MSIFDLKVTEGKEPTVQFTVKNTGARAGAEIAEVYVALPASADEPPKRLAGWSKVLLNPGESKEVSLAINPRELSIYDESTDAWKQLPGRYTFMVGGSSKDLPSTRRLTFHSQGHASIQARRAVSIVDRHHRITWLTM